MEIFLKFIFLVVFVALTIKAHPVAEGLTYVNVPGEPQNIHYVKGKGSKAICKKGSEKTCQTAEIIKVPLRNHSGDCPKGQKKDSKGRCRPTWN